MIELKDKIITLEVLQYFKDIYMDIATTADLDAIFNNNTTSGPVKATTITINNATVDKTAIALTKDDATVQNSTLTIKS